MSNRILVAPGELRADLLRLFGAEELPLAVLLAAPGFTEPFRGRSRVVAQPSAALPVSLAAGFRRVVLEALAREIDHVPQTVPWEGTLTDWMEHLRTGQRKVLHYLRAPLYTRLVSYPDRTLVHPAPLASETWLSSRELDLQLSGVAHTAARRWFDTHAGEAEDISGEVLALLESSWAGGFVDPTDLYCKTLIDYFWTVIEGMDQEGDPNPMLAQLTDFQVKAYEYAKGILRRYGGVFLADVVGLGKTFIGMALLRHLQDRYGEHAVVVAPPNICPAWRELADEHRVNLVTVSIGKLDDLRRYEDREVVVIDESHNFRNRGTKRHETVRQWLRPDGAPAWRKVLLLSATPQNNEPVDVKHQLEFFPDNYSRLPYRAESLDDWFRSVRAGEVSLSDLLQHVVVRRTRRFIISAYPGVTLRMRRAAGEYEEIPLVFPERVSGEAQCLRYGIDAAYGGGLYPQILGVLERLRYAPYGLGLYVLPACSDDARVRGICRAGRSIRGLYKVLVLKRLESSVYAFQRTLQRLRERLAESLTRLDEGLVRVRLPDREAGTDTSDDEAAEPLRFRDFDVPSGLFDVVRLGADLHADLRGVDQLLAGISGLGAAEDAKLQRLIRWLEDRRPVEHRTIVFTQFADTAHYLGESLGQRHGRTRTVTGSSGDALRTARRFAPRANRVDIGAADELDLLLSTDALSEGVNLQDADTLVNYDLHWNPVRLIQRAGRIDRIGSTNESIWVASFLPEAGLEASLGLEQVLRARSREFIAVFGEDSDVLPSDEVLDEVSALGAYTGAALEEADQTDELDGLSRHIERLHQYRREEPERYNRCLAMRPARRALSHSSLPPLTATRVAWYWTFWRRDAGGGLSPLQDQDGLDELYRHASAGPARGGFAGVSGAYTELVGDARDRFEPEAAAFREQRVHPRLRPVEDWVLDRLRRFRPHALASQQPFVVELESWVREGHAKVQLARLARRWRDEDLPPESVFRELTPLYQRFPPVREELPDPEVAFAVMGVGSARGSG